MMEGQPDISVVILCYQAGERIRGFADKVAKLIDGSIPSWEIILVANYLKNTEDVTPRIAQEISAVNKNIKYVARVKQGMMGWDAISGLEKAAGKYICLIDGDEQMPPEDIVRVYKKIKEDGMDLVKTYRVERHDGVGRKLISNVYNVLFNLLFPGTYVRDVNSKPKIFTKAVYDKMNLTSDDWFIDAEMIIHAKKFKLRIGEISTKFYKCCYRKSFIKFNTAFEFIDNLLKTKFKEYFR